LLTPPTTLMNDLMWF